MHKESQWAILTGSTGELGQAFAHELIKRGYHLILIGRDEVKLQEQKMQLESLYDLRLLTLTADLAQPSDVSKIKNFVEHHMLEPQVLINNAGIGYYGTFGDMESSDIASMLSVNILALSELSRAFSRDFSEQGSGYILNVSSIAGLAPMPFMSAYSASKAYVLNFGLALSEELRDTGVSVTTSLPGPIRTKFLLRNGFEDARWTRSPDRLLDPEVVAQEAIRALFARKALVFHRLSHRMIASILQHLPRTLAPRLLRFFV